MAEDASAASTASPKAEKKRAPMFNMEGTTLSELIVRAVAANNDRKGVSADALRKALAAGGYDVVKNKARVRNAIKALVAKEVLIQTTGFGAVGSFKLNKKAETKSKKPTKKNGFEYQSIPHFSQ
ncbi:hypothetical protein INR49_014815 [Caranx melampygus]|nr:hypothetical protein INR49_014815 [Caranx melampygus]